MIYKQTLKILAVCLALQILQSYHPSLMQLQCFRPSYVYQISTLPLFFITLLIHMFSHGSWEHLLGNMFVGIPTMCYVEHHLGSKKMMNLYLISGAVGALVQAMMPFGTDGIIGASGAILGCLGASCLLVPNNLISKVLSMSVLALAIIPQISKQALSFLSPIAHAAHIAGCITGILFVALYYKNKSSN